MSDSWMRAKPWIDEPSKPIPSLIAVSSSSMVMTKVFRKPSTSVNHRWMNSTFRSLTVFMASAASSSQSSRDPVLFDACAVPNLTFPSSVAHVSRLFPTRYYACTMRRGRRASSGRPHRETGRDNESAESERQRRHPDLEPVARRRAGLGPVLAVHRRLPRATARSSSRRSGAARSSIPARSARSRPVATRTTRSTTRT